MPDINDLESAREADRQEFLKAAWRLMLDEQEQSHEATAAKFALSRVFMDHLKKLVQVTFPQPQHVTTVELAMKNFFDTRLLPQIKEFARTRQEENAMVASLADRLFASLTRSFHQELLRQHIQEPHTLYKELGDK